MRALEQSPAMINLLKASLIKTKGVLFNLTQTMPIAGQNQFIDVSDLAYEQVARGALSIDEAVRQGVVGLAEEGIQVINYSRGRVERADVAIRRNLRTAISQTTGDMTIEMAKELGVDTVEVSAHAGARNKGAGPENHAMWQGKVYSISGKGTKYSSLVDATGYGTGPGLLGWNCVLGGAHVTFSRVSAAYRREYSGEVIAIRTFGENELTVTPNHPILTTKGWIAAGSLREGDDVICRATLNGYDTGSPQINQNQPTISEVFSAFSEVGIVNRFPVSSGDFHGDASDGEVDVVLPNSFLDGGLYTSGKKKIVKLPFSFASKSTSSFPPECTVNKVFFRPDHSTNCFMRRGSKSRPFFCCHLGKSFVHCSGTIFSNRYAKFSKKLSNSSLRNASFGRNLIFPQSGIVQCKKRRGGYTEFTVKVAPSALVNVNPIGFKETINKGEATPIDIRNGLEGFPFHIAIDRIISINKYLFTGYVYNLSTDGEWYSANNIITHNCRHSMFLYFPGESTPEYTKKELSRINETTVNYDGQELDLYTATQKQRYLERNIRDWKRKAGALEAAGLDNTEARRKVGEWQTRARDFTKQTGLVRRYEWESVPGGNVRGVGTRPEGSKGMSKPKVKDKVPKGKPLEKKSNILDISQMSDEEQLRAIKDLTDPQQVLELGILDLDLKDEWPESVTDRVVLTGERRSHFLTSHPEMVDHEKKLVEVVKRFSDIHKDPDDRQMAILYLIKDMEHFYRIALWISEDTTKLNSIHSYRIAGIKEYLAEVIEGRSIKKPD